MTEQRFPYVDREGYPLGVDSFVRVEMESTLLPGRVSTFRGLVSELGADGKGPVLTIREWRGGFTGKKRAARPEHCRVKRAPRELRQRQAERAREQAAVRPRGQGRR